MPPSPDPSPAACAPVEGDLGLGWGNAAAQEALGPDLPPGPWAPEVLDRAAGVEGVDAACLLSDPARWAEPADDENPAAPPAAADFWVGSTGPDPLRAASNPIAKAGAPSKTTRTSARFQDDLIDNTSREGQLFDKATATIAHDRAEFRVRHTGDGPHGSEKGAAGSHGENIVRATGDQVMIGRGMSSTDEAGNKHSSEVLVGTGGVAGAASTQLKTADGQTQTLAGGASVGEKGVRGNIRAGLSGPDHTGGLGDPGRATRVTGDGQSAATPDLAREIRDPRNSHAVSTTATATMDGGINVTARLAGQSAAGD